MLTGEHIKSTRKKRGLLQKDVAALAGMSSQQLWQYESGKYVPTFPTLIKLALAMDCSFDDLVGEDFKFSAMDYLKYLESSEGQATEKDLAKIGFLRPSNPDVYPHGQYVTQEGLLVTSNFAEYHALFIFRSLDEIDKEKALDYLMLLEMQEKYKS